MRFVSYRCGAWWSLLKSSIERWATHPKPLHLLNQAQLLTQLAQMLGPVKYFSTQASFVFQSPYPSCNEFRLRACNLQEPTAGLFSWPCALCFGHVVVYRRLQLWQANSYFFSCSRIAFMRYWNFSFQVENCREVLLPVHNPQLDWIWTTF